VRVFGDDVKVPLAVKRVPASARVTRIAFDSRPASKAHGAATYARCLLAALREISQEEDVEIVETHRPFGGRGRRVELFHTPWMEGAVLRSPCPMVVTLHDLDALTCRSERLRRGGMHMRLRHLALQRATQVIVDSEEVAEATLAKLGLERERVVVIPQPCDPAMDDVDRPIAGTSARTWSWEEVARATWEVYERALAEPTRPFISRARAASRRR
jgi:Glycosyltransferase Family 4